MSQQRLDGKVTLVDFAEALAVAHTGPDKRVDWVAMKAACYPSCPPDLLPDMRAAQEAMLWNQVLAAVKVRDVCPVRTRAARPDFGGKLFDLPVADYVQYERQNWIGSLHDQRKIAKRALRYCREKHLSYAKIMAAIAA